MKRIVLAAVVAVSLCAQADVVYNWQTVDAKGATVPIGGRLVVTDEAYRAGSVDYRFQPLRDQTADPSSPVIELLFYVNNETYLWTMHYYREGRGFEDLQESYVRAVFGDELDGAIGSGGTYAAMSMTSGAGLWTVDWLSTERPRVDVGCWMDVCEGVTGRWVLDQSSIPVPTPGTAALAGLALSLLAIRTRRQQANG